MAQKPDFYLLLIGRNWEKKNGNNREIKNLPLQSASLIIVNKQCIGFWDSSQIKSKSIQIIRGFFRILIWIKKKLTWGNQIQIKSIHLGIWILFETQNPIHCK